MRASSLVALAALGALVSGCMTSQPKTGATAAAGPDREKTARTRAAETKKNLTAKSLLGFSREFPDRAETAAMLSDLEAARLGAAAQQDTGESWFLFLSEFPGSARKAEALERYRAALGRRIKDLKSPYLTGVSKSLAGASAATVPATAGQEKLLAEGVAASGPFHVLLCARVYSSALAKSRTAAGRLTAMAGIEDLAASGTAPDSCKAPEASVVRKETAAEFTALLQKMRRASLGAETLEKADHRYRESLDLAKQLVTTSEKLAKDVSGDAKASVPAKDSVLRARLAVRAYEKRAAEVAAARQTLSDLSGFEKSAALLAAEMVGF